jgi:plastocyanin
MYQPGAPGLSYIRSRRPAGPADRGSAIVRARRRRGVCPLLYGGVEMTVPKLVAAVPFVILGAVAPALHHHEPLPTRPNLVGMGQVTFDRDVITIHRGDEIEFVNNSNFLHVIGPGDRARITSEPSMPSFGTDDVQTMTRGDPFVTGPWNHIGSYQLTCALHPEMNLRVVVTG